MSDLVMERGDSPEWAWLLPLGTMPLALVLACGASGLQPVELWNEGGIWLGAIGVAGLLSSAYAARIISASSSTNGPPPALALLAFLFPHAVAVFATRATLAEIFVARTYCGPASREQVITWSLAETMLFRLVPLFISCAGMLSVAIAAVFISRRLERRVRWATIASASVLAWSLAVSALSVAFVRRNLATMLENSFDAEGTWLRGVAHDYGDYATSSNTLLLASIVLALASLSRLGGGLRNAVTLGAVVCAAVGVRAAVLIDEAQFRSQFDEFPILDEVRPLATVDEWFPGLSLGGWMPAKQEVEDRLKSLSDNEYGFSDQSLLDEAHAKGVRVPWPVGLSASSAVTQIEFRRGLRAIREGGVSDVIFYSPIAPFGRAPGGLRPLVEFQNSFDWSDPISVRFADEAECEATNLGERPMQTTPHGLQSAWRLPCESIGIEKVTADNLHALATAALVRGHRLVVVLPRKP